MDMFSQDATGNASMQISPLPPTPRDALSYEDVVKELIHEEKQYQRELHMIIRVFREELAKVVKDPAELEPIFANITDIYELTVTLLGSLEDVIEMAQEEAAPCVGNCFEGECGLSACLRVKLTRCDLCVSCRTGRGRRVRGVLAVRA